MANETDSQITPESTLERADRIRKYIESLISAVKEHPDCELKSQWRRNNPYGRAEAIKDVQSIANSSIHPEKDKFIVVGVDEGSRSFVGCNPADYDEADIRQLLVWIVKTSNLNAGPTFLFPEGHRTIRFVASSTPPA